MSFYKSKREDVNTKKVDRLYLIEFEIEGEYVIKCGKASGKNSMARLFGIIESYVKYYNASPYACIIRDTECDQVFQKEGAFHDQFKSRRYFPTHEFSGFTELFSIGKEEALRAYDKIIGTDYNRGETKECYTCKENKSTIEYSTNKAKADGLNHECKQCNRNRQSTKKGLINRMYHNQVSHSKSRRHPRPAYTSNQLREWLLAKDEYSTMYDTYISNGMDKNLVPSVDRIDPSKPYTLDNIQLLTFIDNMKRNAKDQGEKASKKVIVVNPKTGEMLCSAYSITAAAEVVGGCNKNVQRSVDAIGSSGKINTCSGFAFISMDNAHQYINDDGLLHEKYRK